MPDGTASSKKPGPKQEPDATISEQVEREKYVATLEELARDVDSRQWQIADEIVAANTRWGDTYDEAVTATGRTKSTLSNWVSVAKKFESSGRREDSRHLRFSHFEAAASVKDEKERNKLVGRAEAKKLTVQAVRDEARKLNGVSGSTAGSDIDAKNRVVVTIPRGEYPAFLDASTARQYAPDEEKMAKEVAEWLLNLGREKINQGAGLAVVKDVAEAEAA